MTDANLHRYLPQILAVLIDRAGGVVGLTPQDVERIATMDSPELEFMSMDRFTDCSVKIRFRERLTIPGETVSPRDLLGIDPDFTGGLSTDEYMDEQRGRASE